MTGDMFFILAIIAISVIGAVWIRSAKPDAPRHEIEYPVNPQSNDDYIMPQLGDTDAKQAYTSRRNACQNLPNAEAGYDDAVERAPGMVRRHRDVDEMIDRLDGKR
jgi:hypothetical protein